MKVSVSAIIFGAVLGVASARMAYQFAAGYEEIIGQPNQSFSCDNRPYGYYADVDNQCRVFHICVPIVNDIGEVVSVDHFSFMCGNQTIFSQESLTCADPLDAFPCEDAPTLYDIVNAEFGRIPEDSDFQ